jgi:hypothetical protein
MVGGHRLVTVMTGARPPSMAFPDAGLDAGLDAGSNDVDGWPAPAMTVKERWPAVMIPVGLALHRR